MKSKLETHCLLRFKANFSFIQNLPHDDKVWGAPTAFWAPNSCNKDWKQCIYTLNIGTNEEEELTHLLSCVAEIIEYSKKFQISQRFS